VTLLCVAQLVPFHHGMIFSSFLVNVVVELAQIKNNFVHIICIMHFWLLYVLSFSWNIKRKFWCCLKNYELTFLVNFQEVKKKENTPYFHESDTRLSSLGFGMCTHFFLCHSMFFLFYFLPLCEHNVFLHHLDINQMNFIIFYYFDVYGPTFFHHVRNKSNAILSFLVFLFLWPTWTHYYSSKPS